MGRVVGADDGPLWRLRLDGVGESGILPAASTERVAAPALEATYRLLSLGRSQALIIEPNGPCRGAMPCT
jgi:hypothetical protein